MNGAAPKLKPTPGTPCLDRSSEQFCVCIALGAVRKHVAAALDEIADSQQLTNAGELTIEVFLTPGVLVEPGVAALIDADGDDMFSRLEASAYAALVLDDVSLTVDEHVIELNAADAQ